MCVEVEGEGPVLPAHAGHLEAAEGDLENKISFKIKFPTKKVMIFSLLLAPG